MRRLFWRAGFGATPREAHYWARRGKARTIRWLLHGGPSPAPRVRPARLEAVTSPFRTAERFSVEEIIDPRDTRPILCDWAERAHEIVHQKVGVAPRTRGLRP